MRKTYSTGCIPNRPISHSPELVKKKFAPENAKNITRDNGQSGCYMPADDYCSLHVIIDDVPEIAYWTSSIKSCAVELKGFDGILCTPTRFHNYTNDVGKTH